MNNNDNLIKKSLIERKIRTKSWMIQQRLDKCLTHKNLDNESRLLIQLIRDDFTCVRELQQLSKRNIDELNEPSKKRLEAILADD
ncbi:hypothetical protein [Bacillus cereus]|uniref:hypothetical protein n=1 Tax=Bacillus cereus TaxID=1396 RepID=UPI000B4A7346|nr:hypothetical protein [Bacillus cereus]